MENIMLNAWIEFGGLVVLFILTFVAGRMTGYDKGYVEGRRDERIKQYKELQYKKPNFIDAD